MTNRTIGLRRRGWDLLKQWLAAMEYSYADYTNERISWLEHEVGVLKGELKRIRMEDGIPVLAGPGSQKPS